MIVTLCEHWTGHFSWFSDQNSSRISEEVFVHLVYLAEKLKYIGPTNCIQNSVAICLFLSKIQTDCSQCNVCLKKQMSDEFFKIFGQLLNSDHKSNWLQIMGVLGLVQIKCKSKFVSAALKDLSRGRFWMAFFVKYLLIICFKKLAWSIIFHLARIYSNIPHCLFFVRPKGCN